MNRKMLRVGIILLVATLIFWLLPTGILYADDNGSITIFKSANGFDSGDFEFRIERKTSGGWVDAGTCTIPATGGSHNFTGLKLDGYRVVEIGTNGATGVANSLTGAPTAVDGTVDTISDEFRLDRGNPTHKDVYFDNFKANPSISITKDVSPDSVEIPGAVNYTITVKNTGNVELTNVHVTDSLVDLGHSPTTLAPSAEIKFQYDYTCSNVGTLTNTANVTADGGLSESDSASVECTEPEPEYVSIYIEKTTDGPYTSGDFVFQILRAFSGGDINIGGTNYTIERTVTIPYTGGNTTVTELPPDGYIVRETENLGSDQVDWSFGTPELEGIINDTTSQFRLDNPGDHKNVYFLNFKQSYGNIIVNKSGLLDNDQAIFTLNGPEGWTETITTGNGTIEFDQLLPGEYTLVETWHCGNAYCYKQDSIDPAGPYQIDGNTIEIDVVNKAKGYMRIIKDGLEDGDEAIFTVSNTTGWSDTQQFGNNAPGGKVFGPLPMGTYTVTETFPGGNVWLYDTDHDDSTEYVISCDDTYEEVSITNTARKGKITITKQGLNCADQATFTVTGPNSYESTQGVSNGGTIVFDGLYYGEYSVAESWPEANDYCYEIESVNPVGPYDVMDSTIEITVVNDPVGEITIVKSGFEDGDASTFTIDGPGDFTDSVTMGNGSHTFSTLPKGSYTITEEGEGDNKWEYDVSFDPSDTVVIDCDNTSHEVAIENTAIKGSVEIYKTDKTSGLPLGGSTFQLFMEGDPWTQIGPDIVLDDTGYYKWEGLEYGWYMLVEAEAPEGYLVEGPVEFGIYPDEEVEYTFIEEIADPRIPGTIEIFKYAGGDPLEGVEFDVTNGDDFSIKVVTGVDGIAKITGLSWDTYYIKEVSVPDPTLYEINPNQFVVSISRFNLAEGLDVENTIIPPPTPTPPIEVAGITGIEVLGISEELPFTGMDMSIPFSGIGVVLAGATMLIISRKKKK